MVEATLSYLGVRGEADAETLRLVLDCLEELKKETTPKHVLRYFKPNEADGLLCGEDIRKHLSDAREIVCLAATLGIEADRLIKKYQVTDMARAATLDAAAAAYIEAYCDGISFEREGLFPTMRFSPGYGDYPLSMQPQILKAVRAEKIGISALQSLMLVPTKSVTALLGLCAAPVCTVQKCARCDKKDCTYKRR